MPAIPPPPPSPQPDPPHPQHLVHNTRHRLPNTPQRKTAHTTFKHTPTPATLSKHHRFLEKFQTAAYKTLPDGTKLALHTALVRTHFLDTLETTPAPSTTALPSTTSTITTTDVHGTPPQRPLAERRRGEKEEKQEEPRVQQTSSNILLCNLAVEVIKSCRQKEEMQATKERVEWGFAPSARDRKKRARRCRRWVAPGPSRLRHAHAPGRFGAAALMKPLWTRLGANVAFWGARLFH
ncbi:unnamed protein product [Discula destructiva]